MVIPAEMKWKKAEAIAEDWSAEWARLMKDQDKAWDGAQALRKEISRRVGQSSSIPPDLLDRVDAADRQTERERGRQREFLGRWMQA